MKYRLVLLASFWFSSHVAVARTLTCDALLKIQPSRKAQAAAAEILENDEDESNAYGYVGVSDGELLELLNAGRISSILKHRYTTDHPAFAHLGKFRRIEWREAVRVAIHDAWVKSVYEFLRAKQSGAPPDAKQLLTFLDRLEVTVDGDHASANFAQIERAIEAANLPGFGDGPWPRLHRVARLLGVPWTPNFKRGDATARALVAALSYLPAGAGARLILSDRVANRLKFADGSMLVTDLTIKDVIGIRASSPAGDAFLEDVRRRAGAR